MVGFKIIGICLVIIHLFLEIWALGGMLELLNLNVPWKPYSNPAFPRWLLVFHWGTVLFAATGFLWGYITNWIQTPNWMLVGYGMMALVCIVETFGYMTGSRKFLAMGLEYLAYIIILVLLYNPQFRSNFFYRQ